MDGFPPTYRVHHEDCLLIDDHELTSQFDFIYLEPPADMPIETDFRLRLEAVLPHLNEHGFMIIHLSGDRVYDVKRVMDASGLPFKGDIVWTYRQRAVKTKALQNQHETMLVYSANPLYHPKRVLIAQSVVAPSSNERTGYPTQKPLDLLKRVLRRMDEYHRVQTVLDPFMGSGTTLVAGLELGKTVVGFDISPIACRIADKRLHSALPASRQLQLELD